MSLFSDRFSGIQIRLGRRHRWTPATRERMVRETNDFLTRALRHGRRLPRVPRRRADLGGYADLIRVRGARAAAHHFWKRMAASVWLD